MSDYNTFNTLDKIRIDKGNNKLSDYFYKTLLRNPSKAVTLINQSNLSFPAFNILIPQISKPYLLKYLNKQNKAALKITKGIRSKNFSRFSQIVKDIDSNTPEILKWILESSKDEDMSRGEYIEILDSCAIMLVKEFRDDSILPVLKEIIYSRYKQGLFFHDILWAFFESRNPNCILMLAESLNSSNEKDVELSKKLLKFIPVAKSSVLSNEILYKSIFYWLRDNYPFIFYTGECFQQMPNPSPFEVSLDAKYLFKKVSSDGSIENSLTQDEMKLINIFDTLDNNSKILLSNYSFILRNQNIYLWNNWIHYPISEQLKISVAKLGGTSC